MGTYKSKYSGVEIDQILNNAQSDHMDVADNKSQISGLNQALTDTKKDLQHQINTLVLESGGDSNLEVVNARADMDSHMHGTLNDRLESDFNKKADKNTVESLQSQVSTNTTKTVDLQSQIDSLVLGAGGDSNPEVVQARTDENGTTHETLKARIDSSVTDLKSDLTALNKIIEKSIITNYVNKSLTVTQYRAIGTSGEILSDNIDFHSYVSNFVDISNCDTVKITAQANYGHLVYAFYDESNVFISGLQSANTESRTAVTELVVNIPVNAKFIVVSRRYNDLGMSIKSGVASRLVHIDGINEVTMKNADFIDVVYDNAFDGNYTNGFTIDGEKGSYKILKNSNRFNMGIVPIKPDTVYTVVSTSNNSLPYFLKYGTATKILSENEYFDGSIQFERQSQTGNYAYTFTSGANDKYLYIYGIDYDKSDSNRFYQVSEGTVSGFTTDEYDVYHGVLNDKVKISDISSSVPQIKLKKIDNSNLHIFVPSADGKKTVRYDFVKYHKVWDTLPYTDASGTQKNAYNVVSSDYWNNIYVYSGDGIYIAQGNSNFITKVGNVSHAGNGHGNEVLKYCEFICDGNVININAMANGSEVNCSNCRLIQRSNVFKVDVGGTNEYDTTHPVLDTNGEPVINFEHKMEMLFKIGNDVYIDNKLIIKRDNIKFEQCHGAMLECYYGTFTNVICNNSESTRNIVDSNGNTSISPDSTIDLKADISQKCNTVEMFGNGFYIRQEMIQEDVSRNNKSNVVFNFYNNRLKCYFQPVSAVYGGSSESAEIFNAGDVISVKNHRVIELT